MTSSLVPFPKIILLTFTQCWVHEHKPQWLRSSLNYTAQTLRQDMRLKREPLDTSSASLSPFIKRCHWIRMTLTYFRHWWNLTWSCCWPNVFFFKLTWLNVELDSSSKQQLIATSHTVLVRLIITLHIADTLNTARSH